MKILSKYLAAQEACCARCDTVPSGRGGRSDLCSFFLKRGLIPTYDPPPGISTHLPPHTPPPTRNCEIMKH